jgi:uncharacterized membrane protein YqjE
VDDHLDDGPAEEASRGLFASLRSLIDRVLAVLQTRGELLSTELEEEVTRLVGMLVWSFAGVFAAIVGLCFVGVAILLAAPANWRVPVAIVFAVAFLGVALAGWLSIRRIARAKPRPFDASLGELDKDLQKLRSKR